MTDKVVHFPTRIDQLAKQINDDLRQADLRFGEWVQYRIRLCLGLKEARDLFPNNADFGSWCEANGFGEVILSKDDRAAAIAMGRNPERLQEVFEQTTRRSLRLIYQIEFLPLSRCEDAVDENSLRSAAKTPSDLSFSSREENDSPSNIPPPSTPIAPTMPSQSTVPPKPAPKPPKPAPAAKPAGSKVTPEIDKALQACRKLATAGKPVTVITVCAETGLSRSPVEKAFAIWTVQDRAMGIVEPTKFSPTVKQQFDKALRDAKAQMRVELEAEIRAHVHKQWDEHWIPDYLQKAKRADRIIDNFKGIMSKATYRKILAALHPDGVDEDRKARYSELFQLFKGLEDVLVKEPVENTLTRASTLPKTVQEMMARKAEMDAARRAKQQQKKQPPTEQS